MIRSSREAASASWPSAADTAVEILGACSVRSPLRARSDLFVDDSVRILAVSDTAELSSFESGSLPTFEAAGPRADLFHDPRALTCGIVTCGGLCPGLNNVIRSVVLALTYGYGVRRILGYRYGYAGLTARPPAAPVELTPDAVAHAHERGGTLLSSSRGKQDVAEMVATLEASGVGLLFVIAGDGGLSGAGAIAAEVARRGLSIGVIGIPKTIDNDIAWIWRSFGFATAVDAGSTVLVAGHSEALGAWNGVGLVKLMGRHAGFIAAHASLASSDVNFCLVPEVSFDLEGEGGFLDALERRLDEKRHALVVVAEGAGQGLFAADTGAGARAHDASGNVRLDDVGVLLRDRISAHFETRRKEATVKYIDPSYTIRSLPANPFDAQLCLVLGQHAVHAGMAGRTNCLVGTWNQRFTHVPLQLATRRQRSIDPDGELWQRVLEATGQPASMVAKR